MTQQPPTLTEMLAAKLEPEADYAESRNGVYIPAITSIAISLKRIADQMDGSATTRGPIGLADTLAALPYFLNRFGGQQS